MTITKIEWCGETNNACRGCLHGCAFCYARKLCRRLPMMKAGVWLKKQGIPYRHLPQKERLEMYRKTPVWCEDCYNFRVHFHPEELNRITPQDKPKKIFMDSLWDWNANAVKDEWLQAILAKMAEYPQHTFMILSRRPDRYGRFQYPPNVWLGTSISKTEDRCRIQDLGDLKSNNLRFLSIEPLHEAIDLASWFRWIDWIILGAETGHRKGKIRPEKEWIEAIIRNCREEGIPLFIKDNVAWEEKVREYPKEFGRRGPC